jgi:hypothetical protein
VATRQCRYWGIATAKPTPLDLIALARELGSLVEFETIPGDRRGYYELDSRRIGRLPRTRRDDPLDLRALLLRPFPLTSFPGQHVHVHALRQDVHVHALR